MQRELLQPLCLRRFGQKLNIACTGHHRAAIPGAVLVQQPMRSCDLGGEFECAAIAGPGAFEQRGIDCPGRQRHSIAPAKGFRRHAYISPNAPIHGDHAGFRPPPRLRKGVEPRIRRHIVQLPRRAGGGRG